jgi:hypothetical protein
LLEREPDGVANFALAHAEQGTPLTHATADVDINWVRLSHEY